MVQIDIPKTLPLLIIAP